MKYYRCKCGEAQSWGSMPPPPCMECSECQTTLEVHPDDHRRAKPHNYQTHEVQTDEGMKPLTQCIWCLKKKGESHES